ncbi:ketopantoate reductase family protein [Pendulispora albinea]|uniref:2-dehydropantoate 2-reductase n=1 Tax=Pendulispora albinea TaxID=2741071 RepID=A0ABZ2M853_9BACT
MNDIRRTDIRRIVLCGAGAVGSTYVERLFELDPECIAVVARGARRADILRNGVIVNGRSIRVRCLAPQGEGEGNVHGHGDAPGDAPPADLVILGVKQHHLTAAIEDVRPWVGERTILVSLLNGISSEAMLAAAFGADKVLHAFMVGNDGLREGNATRYSNFGRLVFGAASGDVHDPRVTEVSALLERARIPHEVRADIVRALWWKFMLNVGVNQVSAVLRAPYRAFAEVVEVQTLTRRASLEAVAVARCEGVNLTNDDVDSLFPILASLDPNGKTSMLQDVEAGRKTEVEIFAGTVIELGQRHGVPTPVNELLQTMIAALERLAGVYGRGALATSGPRAP